MPQQGGKVNNLGYNSFNFSLQANNIIERTDACQEPGAVNILLYRISVRQQIIL